jgi:hypothetical protein
MYSSVYMVESGRVVRRRQVKQLLSASFGSSLRDDLALALHDASHAGFVFEAATASAANAQSSVDVGFIHLHRRPLQLQISIGHPMNESA